MVSPRFFGRILSYMPRRPTHSSISSGVLPFDPTLLAPKLSSNHSTELIDHYETLFCKRHLYKHHQPDIAFIFYFIYRWLRCFFLQIRCVRFKILFNHYLNQVWKLIWLVGWGDQFPVCPKKAHAWISYSVHNFWLLLILCYNFTYHHRQREREERVRYETRQVLERRLKDQVANDNAGFGYQVREVLVS